MITEYGKPHTTEATATQELALIYIIHYQQLLFFITGCMYYSDRSLPLGDANNKTKLMGKNVYTSETKL